MAQNVTINGVDYPDVPAVSVPLTSGSGNALFLDAEDYRTAADQDVIDAAQDTAISAKYSKPASGIPSSDMSAAVQTSLGKADTALQSHQSLSAYRTASAQNTIDSGKLNTSGGTVSGNLAISGKFNTSGKIVLTEGVNFGTTAQRSALTGVENGQLFFVRS